MSHMVYFGNLSTVPELFPVRFILKAALASFLVAICWVIGFSWDRSYTDTVELLPGVTLTQEIHVYRSPLSWYGACGQYVPFPIPSSYEVSTSAEIAAPDGVIWAYRNPTPRWSVLMSPDLGYALLMSGSYWLTLETSTLWPFAMLPPPACRVPAWSGDSQWILCESFLGEIWKVDPQNGATYRTDSSEVADSPIIPLGSL
jgi:hypothetical protein